MNNDDKKKIEEALRIVTDLQENQDDGLLRYLGELKMKQETNWARMSPLERRNELYLKIRVTWLELLKEDLSIELEATQEDDIDKLSSIQWRIRDLRIKQKKIKSGELEANYKCPKISDWLPVEDFNDWNEAKSTLYNLIDRAQGRCTDEMAEMELIEYRKLIGSMPFLVK